MKMILTLTEIPLAADTLARARRVVAIRFGGFEAASAACAGWRPAATNPSHPEKADWPKG